MLILAFDTATEVATSALVADGAVLGERVSCAATVLQDVDELMTAAGLRADDVDALAVGIGPGSFTGVRIGLATARALALALDVPVAGVSTLDALAAGAAGATPVVDARRREVFVLQGWPRLLRPGEVELAPGTPCVGNGAVRYRAELEAAGAEIPPAGDERHLPRARFHAQLARSFGPAEDVEPLYLRLPDADRTRA
jgi:tRNA threonylcarbamoyladenosine biosynthesis protein TsaB